MKNKKPLIVIGAVLLIAAAAGYYYTRTRARSNGHVVRVSGNIEVIDAEVSFKIPGRVVRRLVDEGELVKQGDTIAELDRSDLLCELEAQRANLSAAEAALAELEAGSRPQEIAAAEATVARARADLVDAEANYNRVKGLYESRVAAQQEYDSALAQYDAKRAALQEVVEKQKLIQEGPCKEDIDQARAALAEAAERDSMVNEGPRKETIAQARAEVAQAHASVALAQTELGYTTLVSPLSGVVPSKNIEPGEYVAPGTPVVTVGDLVNVWLRAYVNETDLGRVKVGQRGLRHRHARRHGGLGFLAAPGRARLVGRDHRGASPLVSAVPTSSTSTWSSN